MDSVNICEFFNKENDQFREVLGGCELDRGCTYDIGYAKRQALYVCLTCSKDKESAAICFPCMSTCHSGHEIEELNTKRRFRCDCGNEKFTSSCLLIQDKEDSNSLNIYNHNFKNLYCFCDKPEDDFAMYQCIICEDWLHEKCLFGKNIDEKTDIIFPTNKDCIVDETFLPAPIYSFCQSREITCAQCLTNYRSVLLLLAENLSLNRRINLEKISSITELESEVEKLDSESHKVCISDAAEKEHSENKKFRPSIGHVVWTTNWREHICDCSNCKTLLNETKLDFLLDPEDTFDFYYKVADKRLKELDEDSMNNFMTKTDVVTRNTILSKMQEAEPIFMNHLQKLIQAGKGTGENPISREDILPLTDYLKTGKWNEN